MMTSATHRLHYTVLPIKDEERIANSEDLDQPGP